MAGRLFASLLLWLGLATAAAAAVDVTAVRLATSDDGTRVVIDVSGPVQPA